jgi:hypothetical protein
MSNPQHYKSTLPNPLVRASLNGVVSHRIKTLLGTGNYSQNMEMLRMHGA